MKQFFILGTLLLFVHCKEAPKTNTTKEEPAMEDMGEAEVMYPEGLAKVLEAHGGLKAWKSKRTLTYDLPKPNGTETHITDLYSRKDKIEMGSVSMGFDGKEVWLVDEAGIYGGDPIFYHNLMFYFYAMPFVLADEGIVYSEADALMFEDVSYPGIQISYNAGVGTSPKDEYYIHYDPNTNQMAWLGYTVTYRSGEKSDNVKWIRYADWMKVDGLLIPKTLTWHAYEGREIKEAKNKYTFENVSFSAESKPVDFYAIPEKGKVVTKKE